MLELQLERSRKRKFRKYIFVPPVWAGFVDWERQEITHLRTSHKKLKKYKNFKNLLLVLLSIFFLMVEHRSKNRIGVPQPTPHCRLFWWAIWNNFNNKILSRNQPLLFLPTIIRPFPYSKWLLGYFFSKGLRFSDIIFIKSVQNDKECSWTYCTPPLLQTSDFWI